MITRHPSQGVDIQSLHAIQERSAGAELLGELDPAQLEVIYNKKWFKMFVPQILGGLGYTLPEVLKTEEALAWADGSTAWVVTLCSGAGWFIGFIQPEIALDLCRCEKFCIAGSGSVSGTAILNDTYYAVDGYWKYASGALHATVFTGNCRYGDGKHTTNKQGESGYGSFLFMRNEVTAEKSWRAMGMRATGSHSFYVNGLRAPLNRHFVIDPRRATRAEPIYQYPFLQLAETTLAVNLSGMAVRFIDLAEKMFQENSALTLCSVIRTCRNQLNASRNMFFSKVEESWMVLVSEAVIPDKLLLDVSMVSQQLVDQARLQVNILYPRCGVRAAMLDEEINRVWRNFNTAAQHPLFNRK
jgi:indole-3-acetate monooxygenase